jgi:hypothetical protein
MLHNIDSSDQSPPQNAPWLFKTSDKSANLIKTKYHEDIVSDNQIIKNKQIEPTHHSVSFMDFIALVIGNKENYGYYPIYSNGSKPDYGNTYGISSFINKYINDFISNIRNSLFGPPQLNLDPNQINNYMTEFDNLVEQNYQTKLANLTSEDILRTSFEVLYDPNKDILKFIGSDTYYGESNE